MTDNRVDDEVKQFLDWSAQQAREGYTIANLMLKQEQFMGEVRRAQEHFMADVSRLIHGQNDQIRHLNGRVSAVETDNHDIRATVDAHGMALVAIKRRVRTGPHDDEMDTGVHQLAAIQQRLADQEQKRRDSERVKNEEQTWWKRSIIGWVAVGFGFIATQLITVLITMAIANSTGAGHQPPPPLAPAPAPR
jgi:hypothetical protein